MSKCGELNSSDSSESAEPTVWALFKSSAKEAMSRQLTSVSAEPSEGIWNISGTAIRLRSSKDIWDHQMIYQGLSIGHRESIKKTGVKGHLDRDV